MVEQSNAWLPPPMTVGVVPARKRAEQGTAAQRGERRHEDLPLSDLQRDKFEHMLRTLTVERADICAAMAFALDNAESGGWTDGWWGRFREQSVCAGGLQSFPPPSLCLHTDLHSYLPTCLLHSLLFSPCPCLVTSLPAPPCPVCSHGGC